MKDKENSNPAIPPLFGYNLSEKPPLVHCIGIGGIGMSALAQWFLAQNWAITGADLTPSDITALFRKLDVTVKIGHKAANLPRNTTLVVYSQAVGPRNPEIREARRLHIPTVSYPEIVGHLTEMYRTIAIAGAHGKSTVTALTALILARVDLDPTVIIGTKLKEFGDKNFRAGKGRYLVLEADEYGGAFWHYSPTVAVVTNIDREHLDFYKNINRIKESFLRFLSQTRHHGTFVLNRDDKNLFSLKPKIEKIAHERHIQLKWYSLRQPEAKKVKMALSIPGTHNVSNTLAALSVGAALKIPVSQMLPAIRQYRGSWRRMEYRGMFQVSPPKVFDSEAQTRGADPPLAESFKVQVYDDYAHHPAEIRATLSAFREKFPKHTIICVFQPHQAERLKALFDDFKNAFDQADVTLIAPVYQVAGRDKPSSRYGSRALVRAIQKKQPRKLIFYLEKPENIKKALTTLLQATPQQSKQATGQASYRLQVNSVLVMMGAGDIVNYTAPLLSS